MINVRGTVSKDILTRRHSMNYFDGVQLAASLTSKAQRKKFLAFPKDNKYIEYPDWLKSLESTITLDFLFKCNKTIELTRRLCGNTTICLVLRRSGFFERTEVSSFDGTRRRTRTSYKWMTASEAQMYEGKKDNIVTLLREMAREQAAHAIRDAANAVIADINGPDLYVY